MNNWMYNYKGREGEKVAPFYSFDSSTPPFYNCGINMVRMAGIRAGVTRRRNPRETLTHSVGECKGASPLLRTTNLKPLKEGIWKKKI